MVAFDLSATEYAIYTLTGILAIGLLAWGLDRYWRRRHPGQKGGAAGYLLRIVNGYELTPTRGAQARYLGPDVRSTSWTCALSDDRDAARRFLLAPSPPLDRMLVLCDGQPAALSGAGEQVVRAALRAEKRTLAKACRALKRGRGRARRESRHPALAGPGADAVPTLVGAIAASESVTVRSGAHDVVLNRAGREFVGQLIAAKTSQFDDCAHHLGLTATSGGDWMPADEFRALGGVNRAYED